MDKLKRKRVKSLRKIITVESTMYLKVSEVGVPISLTKRRISEKHLAFAQNRTKIMSKLIKFISEICDLYKQYYEENNKSVPDNLLEIVFTGIIWNIDYDNVNVLIKMITDSPDLLVKHELFDDQFRELALKHIQNNITITPSIIEQQFKLLSYDPNGVEIIKEILLSLGNIPKLKVSVNKSPVYKLELEGENIDDMSKIIDESLKIIESKISENLLYTRYGELKIIKNGGKQLF